MILHRVTYAVTIYNVDCLVALRAMPANSVHCVVTSPPYWGLRDYGVVGQIGLEHDLDEHIRLLVEVFREVHRVLRPDGTVWVNYGDAYASAPNGRSAADGKATGNDDRTFRDKPISTVGGVFKPKDRMLLPARVAIALHADGWWLRDEIIWHKPNPMPSSVKDRTTIAHEMIYMFSKSPRYYYDAEAIREPTTSDVKMPGRNSGCLVDRVPQSKKIKVPGGWDKGDGAHGTIHRAGRTAAEYVESVADDTKQKRSVWTVSPKGFKEAHFATFPPDLIRPCILAGCPVGGTVLDPFFGAGTTGVVAQELGRRCVGIELNPEYVDIAARRIRSAPAPASPLLHLAQAMRARPALEQAARSIEEKLRVAASRR